MIIVDLIFVTYTVFWRVSSEDCVFKYKTILSKEVQEEYINQLGDNYLDDTFKCYYSIPYRLTPEKLNKIPKEAGLLIPATCNTLKIRNKTRFPITLNDIFSDNFQKVLEQARQENREVIILSSNPAELKKLIELHKKNLITKIMPGNLLLSH